MTGRQALRALGAVGVASFLFIVVSLSMEGRYVPAEWDERIILGTGMAVLVGGTFGGWWDRG